MINIEILKIVITPITLALISAIFSSPILNLVEQFKRRKLKNYVESLSLLEKLDDDFHKEFINPNLKELYFYIQTGISTNEKSIKTYIELKDKLGGNYSWKQIKLVKRYVNLDETNVLLKINNKEEIASKIVLNLIVALFIVGAIGLMVIIIQSTLISFSNYFYLLFLVFLPIIFGFILMQSVSSAVMAMSMIKRLKEQASRVTAQNNPQNS